MSTKNIRLDDWLVAEHEEVTLSNWYSVRHWHDASPIQTGQWWWTTGEQSVMGWRCANCNEAVPPEVQGFVKLAEWER